MNPHPPTDHHRDWLLFLVSDVPKERVTMRELKATDKTVVLKAAEFRLDNPDHLTNPTVYGVPVI